MNGHVRERRSKRVQISFGESGEGGEIAIQKRQSVIVILDRDFVASWQLVNKTEFAVVVTSPDAIEN